MTPWPHQKPKAKLVLDKLRKYGLAYIAMEERTGKTLVAILAAESALVIKILVITKKKAYDGWHETFSEFNHNKVYTLTTYTQLDKLNDRDYDLIILDEAHNYISAYPDVSTTWKEVKKFTRGKPIIYISATPHAQSLSLLYHQLSLSCYSPWKKYVGFPYWFQRFGKPYTQYFHGNKVPKFDEVDNIEEVLASVQHIFVKATRKELGFTHEPVDKVHYITLGTKTMTMYNTLLKDKVLDIGDTRLICNKVSKLRPALHMLEGGVLKHTSKALDASDNVVLKTNNLILDSNEKVDYIKNTWGDTSNVAIMYNYKAEKVKLERHFKNARILQGTTYAEGISLKDVQTLVVYSQDFSVARHTQRRARQADKNRKTPIVVNFLLVKKGISEEVYTTVSIKKVNYVDSLFERNELC